MFAMSRNRNYHATGCFVKTLHMMNQRIENTVSGTSDMCIYYIFSHMMANYIYLFQTNNEHYMAIVPLAFTEF